MPLCMHSFLLADDEATDWRLFDLAVDTSGKGLRVGTWIWSGLIGGWFERLEAIQGLGVLCSHADAVVVFSSSQCSRLAKKLKMMLA
jgi:hypothetical protein